MTGKRKPRTETDIKDNCAIVGQEQSLFPIMQTEIDAPRGDLQACRPFPKPKSTRYKEHAITRSIRLGCDGIRLRWAGGSADDACHFTFTLNAAERKWL